MWTDRWTDMMKLIVAFAVLQMHLKMYHSKTVSPLGYIMHWDEKPKAHKFQQTVSPHCSFTCCFFASVLMKKDTAETNAYAKEKIVNKTWCQFSVWHECYDGV